MKTVNTLPVISPSRGSIYKSPTSTKERFKFPPISDASSFHKKDLDKHIRNNDVSQVLKESRSPIVEQRDIGDVQQDEVKETSNNLLFLRKKYNEARETCVKMEQEMNKTRIDNDKLKSKENFMVNDISDCHNKLTDLRNALNLQQIRIEEAWENNRVYAQMLDRLKKDRLTDKMKYSNLENALHHELAQLDTETKVAKKALQFGIQTKIVFNGVMRHIEEEDKKRQKDLSIFEKTLTAQEEADMKRAERIERSKEVAETAQSELKDSNEHQWREVEKVHKFLNFFLKRKIEREIRQYETVEKAYQKIKASTGLSDTREIVNKFINREQTYSELLISIADYEKRIAELQKINEERKARIQSLKEASLPSDKFKEEDEPAAKPNLLESYKNLEVVGENYKDTKLVVEKTYAWVIQSLIKIDKAKKVVNNRYYELHPKDRLAEAFLKMIETVKNDLIEIKEQDVGKVLDEIDNTKVDEVVKNETFIARNMRVKPLNTRERMRSIESPTHSKRSFIENEPIEIEIEPNTKEEHEAIESYRVQVKTRILEDPVKIKK